MKKLVLITLLLCSIKVYGHPAHQHAFNGSEELLHQALAGLDNAELFNILNSTWNDIPADHPYHNYAQGRTVVELAALNNQSHIVDTLVNRYHAQLPNNILHTVAEIALARGRVPHYHTAFQRLLALGANPNHDIGGETVLHKIAQLDYYPSALSLMELFAQHGASLSLPNEGNETALDIYLNHAQHQGEERVEQLRTLRTRNNRQDHVTRQIEDAIENHFPDDDDDDDDMPELEDEDNEVYLEELD